MVQYLAAFHNEKGRGPVAQLFSDDEEGEIRAFVAKHDRPGFAVYTLRQPAQGGLDTAKPRGRGVRSTSFASTSISRISTRTPRPSRPGCSNCLCRQRWCSRAGAGCT